MNTTAILLSHVHNLHRSEQNQKKTKILHESATPQKLQKNCQVPKFSKKLCKGSNVYD